MKKLAAFVLFGAVIGALASPALAQDAPRTEIIFDDPDDVLGEAPQPPERWDVVRLRHGRENLIRVRFHFRPELLKSIEDI
jgi:hypothetical protein